MKQQINPFIKDFHFLFILCFLFSPFNLIAQVYNTNADYGAVGFGGGTNGYSLIIGGPSNAEPLMWNANPRTSAGGGGEQYMFNNARAAKIQYEGWGERLRFQMSDYTQSITYGGLISWKDVLVLGNNGNVGIGTLDCIDYRLAVEGNIGCRELLVTTDSWCDYVFDRNYRLMPLNTLELYIKNNNHLPDVPSEFEVMSTGRIGIGQMQRTLLKKVEELNLYVIQLNKKNAELEERLKKIENRKDFSDAGMLPLGEMAAGLLLMFILWNLVSRKFKNI